MKTEARLYTMKQLKHILKNINKEVLSKTAMGICAFLVLFSSYISNKIAVPTSGVLTSPKIPIIMYHSVLDNTDRISKYVITPEILKNDFEYLKKNGFTPILSSDLINFSEKGESLPPKPIIITFDDGYYNNYTYAFPLLKEYGFKAVISLVGEYTTEFSEPDAIINNNYSHLTFDNLKEMQSSGIIEFACHSFDMHNISNRKGILRKGSEDKSHYKELLIADTMKIKELISLKTGKEPYSYTYPFGAVNNESADIIDSLGFKVTYGCEEGLNTITSDKTSLLRLKRFNRDGKMSTEKFFEKVLN